MIKLFLNFIPGVIPFFSLFGCSKVCGEIKKGFDQLTYRCHLFDCCLFTFITMPLHCLHGDYWQQIGLPLGLMSEANAWLWPSIPVVIPMVSVIANPIPNMTSLACNDVPFMIMSLNGTNLYNSRLIFEHVT